VNDDAMLAGLVLFAHRRALLIGLPIRVARACGVPSLRRIVAGLWIQRHAPRGAESTSEQ